MQLLSRHRKIRHGSEITDEHQMHRLKEELEESIVSDPSSLNNKEISLSIIGSNKNERQNHTKAIAPYFNTEITIK
jgi:hypothetical protein